MNFNYLAHSAASFASGTQAVASKSLQFQGAGSRGFDIFALGDNHTTLMDFSGVTPTCISGACDQFTLDFTGANDSFAGAVMHGTLTNKGTASGSAIFAFTFVDDTAVGVGQHSQTLTLTAVSSVTAVPEPHGAAMLLAGLGAIGWMSRRRRSTRDQVAKL
ncbi:MAG: PEP-CTERM sorting domain-containing protein [Burkholderiales bacterium]|nr:PEP-CTERM sorting domain-containing protein [Burkholderiales bacterium]